MNPRQLKELIHTVLKLFGCYSPEAVDLLMLTAAQESHCGRYIKQLGGGPALGIFQMEPRTLMDIIDNYLSHRPHTFDRVNRFVTRGNIILNLTGNLIFQIVIARVHYYRAPEPLPKKTGDEFEYVEKLARYWKKYWNTHAGAGTVAEAVRNYNTYVRRAS